MQEGDIILTSLPQADGQLKNRLALLLRSMPPFGDFLVCGISSQLQQGVEGFDEIIQPSDVDFRDSGLKAPSLIRLGFLAVLPVRSFLGRNRQRGACKTPPLTATLIGVFAA